MDTEKQCSKCKKILPITSFYSRGGGRYRSECKECHSAYVKSQYQNKLDIVQKIKTETKCQKCGEVRSWCLDFHHKDPSIKDDKVSKLTSNRSNLQSILNEIDKCVVLCANCHRDFHHQNSKNNITIEEYLTQT